MSHEEHKRWMRRALALGERGRLTAPPNPWVGCVLVREGGIVGEGYHAFAGEAHAEIKALDQAGEQARGATAYITLEPCAHYGRTPPCCKALIAAGIASVVIPFLDPDPRVSGRGKAQLENANIPVIVGVGAEEAARLLRPYLHHRRTQRPYTLLKIASSLDGKGALADGTSQWITGESARQDVHLLRAQSQAILLGSQTVLRDNPRLTVRGIEEMHTPPLRVVIDRQGILPLSCALFDPVEAPTLLFCIEETPLGYRTAVQAKGIEVIALSQKQFLQEMMQVLGEKGILQLLVEGGSALQEALRVAQLADGYRIYFGNTLLGNSGMAAISSPSPFSLEQAHRWHLEAVHRFDNDVRLDYRFRSS